MESHSKNETSKKDQAKEKRIQERLYIYTNDNFPCFVKNGAAIEDPATAPTKKEKYGRIARNGLRHLTYGVAFKDCKLLTWSNFKSLFIKRDPLLFDMLRKEMQNLFLNVFSCAALKRSDEAAATRLGIFINNLLSAYPFMDPKEGETVLLPQKINNTWECVRYRFHKIDISPQKGLLSKLIEEEDRIYAYGLEPVINKQAQPYLLFIGTTYPSGQGAELNWLYNFSPLQSVGEGHDFTHLQEWLHQHHNVKVVGHSKGGTMAMITAAKFPEYISSADCLNPTALCQDTLARLNPSWEKIPLDKKPVINVYAHVNDPIFLLENSFLENTQIYRFGRKTDTESMLVAHVHYFAGRKSTVITKVINIKQEIPSKGREFVTDVKELLNWVLFPLMYIKLSYALSMRKIKRFCHKHATLLELLFFGTGIGLCILLGMTGVLAPLIVPIIAYAGPVLASAILASSAVAGSAVLTYAAPKLINIVEETTSKSLFTAASALALGSTIAIGGIISLLKIGFKSLFCKPAPPISSSSQSFAENALIKNDSTEVLINSFSPLKKEVCTELSLLAKSPALIRRWKSESDLLKLSFNAAQGQQNKMHHPRKMITRSQSFSNFCHHN